MLSLFLETFEKYHYLNTSTLLKHYDKGEYHSSRL